MSEIEMLKSFRWNVLQAWDRGGDSYIRNTIDQIVNLQKLNVDRILVDDIEYGRKIEAA